MRFVISKLMWVTSLGGGLEDRILNLKNSTKNWVALQGDFGNPNPQKEDGYRVLLVGFGGTRFSLLLLLMNSS